MILKETETVLEKYVPSLPKDEKINTVFHLQAVQEFVKTKLAEVKKDLLDEMQTENIKAYEYESVRGKWLITRKEKTTDRFAHDELKKMLDSENAELRAVAIGALPKSPAWKKTVVKVIMEKTGQELTWEDVSEEIELKMIPPETLEMLRGRAQIKKGVESGNTQS